MGSAPVLTPAPPAWCFRGDQPGRPGHLTQALAEALSERGLPGRELVVCCVGTDRSTGDALGPLVGRALEQSPGGPRVIGTLAEPLHALNMGERVAGIAAGSLVLAVDAALGEAHQVGSIWVCPSGLSPGEGVGKQIPRLGELAITATVAVQAGAMSSHVLQSTRLHMVCELADLIAGAILGAVRACALRGAPRR